MKRNAMQELIKWKNKSGRKPLILSGARQVGKTWLMKEFGRTQFKSAAYINFDSNSRMQELFSRDYDIRRLINGIEIEADIRINPKDTLLIFDEIQEVPRALTSLKYFNENAPEYSITAAGSLLGVAMHSGTSFPVGKVEFIDIHPMTFFEFLEAAGEIKLVEAAKAGDYEIVNVFSGKYNDWLKRYYYTGGMPGVVVEFVKEMDYGAARNIQMEILRTYEQVFSKHMAPDTAIRSRMLWNSIPAQLSKENHKFVYGVIKHGARAKEYELSLAWLSDCGMVKKVHRVSKPGLPLKAYEDNAAFKLYACDVGLLGAMCGLDKKTLLEGSRVYTEFKGALTEQYALQQFIAAAIGHVSYWAPEAAKAEVDFLLQAGNSIIPVEAKAEENLHAKSLKSYIEKHKPDAAIRLSMAGYRKDGRILNVPLYLAPVLGDIIYKELQSAG